MTMKAERDDLGETQADDVLGQLLHRLQEALDQVAVLQEACLKFTRIGIAMTTLAEKSTLITTRPEEEGFFVTAIEKSTGRPASAGRAEMADALAALIGGEPTKRCQRCKEPLPLWKFSHYQHSTDGTGRNPYCLDCERKRVREYKEKKRLEKQADAQAC
jgi:hypothetical protein